ncbi:uncharacterized protein N7479_008342 [Penicillium vulpinum]|nr:uncharacterized protein N7479_008342 [Penicillium vulpinum]KAJ5961192.1 hypothetical protein N7479_008342 [Penicillium vulpinum]
MSGSDARTTDAACIKVKSGAPSNCDWDEVEFENPTDEDQSTDLPDQCRFEVFFIEPLKERENFDVWLEGVEQYLRPLTLHHLLDATIKRPFRDSPNAEKWRQLSQQVRAWLTKKMDAKVLQGIMARGGRVTFADEFMAETRKFMLDEGHDVLSAAILKLIKKTRSEFDSPEEFIAALKSRYKLTSDLKGQVPPYTAVIIMFQELQSIPRLGQHIRFWNNELRLVKNPAANITCADFLAFTSAISEVLNKINDQSTFWDFSKRPKMSPVSIIHRTGASTRRPIQRVSQFGQGDRLNDDAE